MRILFVSSNSSKHYLDIEREQRTLLKLAEQGGHFLKFLPAATKKDLESELGGNGALKKYHVLHFAGHGTEEGILLKSGDDAEIDEGGPPLTPPQLADIVKKGKDHAGLRLVVLNACKTEKLVDEITALADEVIGTTRKVEDWKAKEFTGKFYEALNNNATVKDAFDDATTAKTPYVRPGKGGSFVLPPEAPGEARIVGLGDFYNKFYGDYIDEQIDKVKRDQRLNNYVFWGLMSIAVCVWIYLFHTGNYGTSGGVFWDNVTAALADAFYPGTEAGQPELFSMDGLWNRVQKLQAFAPVLIAFFQRTVFFQTGPKLDGLRRLREAIRNWDDLPDEDQEMVRSAMHTSLKESLQS